MEFQFTDRSLASLKAVFKNERNDLTTRRRALLEYTARFYTYNNRAVEIDQEEDYCVYSPTEDSPGCAVGQHIPRSTLRQMKKSSMFEERLPAATLFSRFEDVLPSWMESIQGPPPNDSPLGSSSFWSLIQHLHDTGVHWMEEGLSSAGQESVDHIASRFELLTHSN